MSFRFCCFLALLVLAGCGGSSDSPPTVSGFESAVAFTPDLQNYGYCYDTADANLCAEKYCFEGSGVACGTLFRSADHGHYSLALGNSGWGIGFSSADRDAAGQSAMDQCWQRTQGCRVVETWQADGVK
jgi:hypothetical protein